MLVPHCLEDRLAILYTSVNAEGSVVPLQLKNLSVSFRTLKKHSPLSCLVYEAIFAKDDTDLGLFTTVRLKLILVMLSLSSKE